MSHSRSRGLSLIEVLVAMGLVASAVLALVSVYLGGIKLSRKSEKILLATETAKAMLEVVREKGFDAIPAETKIFRGQENDPRTEQGFPPDPYPAEGDFFITVETRERESNLRSVTVKVIYDGKSSVSLQTYVTPFDS